MFRSRENDSRVLYLETKVPSALESTHMRESERESERERAERDIETERQRER